MASRLKLNLEKAKGEGPKGSKEKTSVQYRIELVESWKTDRSESHEQVSETTNDGEVKELKSTSKSKKKGEAELTGIHTKKVTKVTIQSQKETWWIDTDDEASGLPNEQWLWRATPESEHQR